MKYKLSDICSFRKGKVEVENLNTKNYISTENMLPNKCGIIEASSLPSVDLTQEYKNGDILVSNIRPYFKKIWKAKYDGGCSNDVLVFVAKSNTDRNFLYYVLSDDYFFTYSMTTSKGTKMPRGDKTSIMQYEVPMIDLQRQKKIASILKSFDEKIEVNNVINNNLLEHARLMYKNRFIDMTTFDGIMPNEWHMGTVSEIIKFHDSKRVPLSSRERTCLEKIYPYYGATSVMDYVDRYLFDGVYLLIGEDGTVIDNKGFPILQYVEGKFWVNNHAHIITGKNGYSVELLYLLLSMTNVQSIVTGAVQPKISQANLNKLPVVIPSTTEIQSFDSIIQPIFSQIRILRAENDRLATTRDTLLPKLMSGELDISDIDI